MSPAMVSKWAKAGRLVIDEDGRVLFGPTDDGLAASAHPLQGGRRVPVTSVGVQVTPIAGGFIESKRRQTDASADLLELRLQRERGEVHETAACSQAIAAALAGPISKLSTLFVRIAPQLAAETQVRRIQDIGEDEVTRILQEIADALRGLVSRSSTAKQ